MEKTSVTAGGAMENQGNGSVPVGEGSLVVLVTTSDGGYPLEGAIVSVYNEEGTEKFIKTETLYTDRDGKTPVIRLPAPVLTPEQLYECKIRPYNVYTVALEYPRFYTNIHKDVQVYANIESILNSFMMPLPANIGDAPKTKVYIIPPTRCLGPTGGGVNG